MQIEIKKRKQFIIVTILLFIGIHGISFGDIIAVSNRTPEVRDAIVAAIPEANSASDVTDAHLATITVINLRAKGISKLKAGDFSGLTALTNLNLYGNNLSRLPKGIFSGLTALTTLRLGRNIFDPMPLIVMLEKIDVDSYKVVIYAGAPFDIKLPINIINSGISTEATIITIPKGSIESNPFTIPSSLVTSTDFTVEIGTLPILPRNHYGYTLARSTACHRTLAVRRAIVNVISEVTECRDVTDEHLASIHTLNLEYASLTSLRANDFAGLTSLETLYLGNNNLTTLPADIFSDLSNLRDLYIQDNNLRSLPEDVFSSLSSIRQLNLHSNQLTTLPKSIFSGLPSLTQIFLHNNQLTTLDSDIFSDVSTLRYLYLNNNRLTTLPENLFSNITSLEHLLLNNNRLRNIPQGVFSGIVTPTLLWIHYNPTITLPLTISLEKISDGQFKVVVPAGAPININLSLSVTNGSITDGTNSITIPAGSVESDPIDVTRTPNSLGVVTVDIAILSKLPQLHLGYTLTKSEDLPLEVISGINTAPVFTEGETTTRTVSENTASNADIGTPVTATDADNDTLTYILSGADTASFGIDSTTGQLKTKAKLDFETKNTYTVTIIVSDEELTDSINVTINITDLDEVVPNRAPVFTEGTSTTRTVAEKTLTGVEIGTPVSATDPDNDALLYTLGGADADIFELESTTGQLKTKKTLDFDTQSTYKVTLTVSDSKLTDSIDVTITVTEINETIPNRAPTFKDGDSTTRSIAENSAAGTDIGTAIAAIDPDGNTLSYTLGGTDAASFNIVAATGQLETKSTLDYETKNAYTVTITVSDGLLTDTINVTINVTDVVEIIPNRAPIFTEGESTTRSVTENTDAGTNIGTAITAIDADNDTLTYTLSSNDTFDIDDTTGQLKTKTTLDRESQSTYTIPVTVSDGSLTDIITVTIIVSNVNEAPEFIEGESTTRTVAEKTLEDVEIGTPISATDPENDTLIYTLGGADADIFELESTTGQLKTKKTLDFDTQSTYKVTLTVSDSKLTDSIDVTITVTEIDETNPNRAPTFKDGDSTTRSIAENTAAGTDIGAAIAATDPDGNTLRYTLGGIDATSFAIEAATGQLKTKSALDYETKISYTVTITVSDGSGGSDSITVTITVTDVDESPPVPTPIGVCNRTPQVRDAIVAAVEVNSCEEVTETHLASISYLNLGGDSITSLKFGDFEGLSSLERLNLNDNQLTSLPEDIFDGLASLEFLSLMDNQLTSLPEDIFDGLASLEFLSLMDNQLTGLSEDIFDGLSSLDHLRLGTNQLSSLPDDVFGGLSSLNELHLNSNQLTSLPDDIFDGLSSLTYLTMSGNQLTSISANLFDDLSSLEILPLFGNQLTNIEAGAFEGLSSLTVLFLNLNPGTPFGFTISLEKVGTNQFKASMPVGASFSVVIPLSVTNGSISGDLTSVTIPVGSVESPILTVTRSSGTTGAITVDIGTLPDLPSDHTGYTLVKSTDLPLTVDGETEVPNAAPVFSDGTSTSRTVAENSAAGTNIGDAVTATDTDNNTLTYTLSGTDAASFDIESTTGQLKTKASLNHETKDSYSVTVTVSDNSLTDTISVTINISDINDAPVFMDGNETTRLILENTASGASFGTPISATDEDDDTLTYSLGGTDVSSFTIDTATGQLKTSAALDYETKSSYLVIVSVTDNKGGTDTISVTISVTDVDEETTTSTFTPVCDRTPQVRDALVAAFGVEDCSDVTMDNLNSLTVLLMNNSNITSLKSGDFDGLIRLHTLQMNSNELNSLPSDIFNQITAMRRLRIENSGLSSLPAGIFDKLTSLEILNLSDNELSSLTDDIFDNNTTLTNLNLSNNDLSSLSTDIFDELTALKTLELSGNDFVLLQDNIFDELTALTSLSLYNNDLSSLSPGIFDELTALTSLSMGGNSLSSLPAGIFDKLTALTSLSMGGNSLSSLPAGIFDKLTALTSLDLSGGDLSSLTVDIFDGLTALESLYLYNNDLSSLSDGIFDELTKLTSLNLSQNNLSSLPADIFDELTALTDLNLGQNDLSSLPADIFDELTALTTLNLGINRLSSLQSDIFDALTSLTTLNLNTNGISSFSSGIFDALDSLSTLRLEQNSLRSLQDALFSDLTSLSTLKLRFNPVDPLPFPVSLEKVSDGQFKAVAPIGAPFDIVLPLTVSNGSVSGSTTSVTISTGTVESGTITVTRASGTTATVTVDIGTLPSIPSSHNGYSLTKSTDLPLEVISAVSGAPTMISNDDLPQLPNETALLSNYPNPFNPETWIPYQLSKPADVSVTIYDLHGVLVRQLTLGHQSAGYYLTRSRAIHWDGRNSLGEKVSTGLYFYVFKASGYFATRKLLIRK